jgi:dUTPase
MDRKVIFSRSLDEAEGLDPEKGTSASAGIDFWAPRSFTIKPFSHYHVASGFDVLFPDGYYGELKEVSSFASTTGVQVIAGVIDSDYQGEVIIMLKNTSSLRVRVHQGMKIAQMLIRRLYPVTHLMMSREMRESMIVPSDRNRRGLGVFDTRTLRFCQTNEQCRGERRLDGEPAVGNLPADPPAEPINLTRRPTATGELPAELPREDPSHRGTESQSWNGSRD